MSTVLQHTSLHSIFHKDTSVKSDDKAVKKLFLEIELAPQQDTTVALGSFKSTGQLKGFSIELAPQKELHENIHFDFFSCKKAEAISYSVRIQNKTNKTLFTQIRTL